MSGCLGRALQKKLSSVAEAPVKTFEFQLCSVLTLLRQGEQGTGGSQPHGMGGRGRLGQESSPRPRHRSITPAALTYTSRATQSLAVPFSRGWRLLDYPQDGRSGGLPQCRAMCRAVPCRLLLTTRRGDAGCEAGAGWKGASCDQEMYCGCWAACAMQHLGDKAQKSARLSGDAGGDFGGRRRWREEAGR